MKKITITNFLEIEEILNKIQICSLSMIDLEGLPYVVPMNFAYYDGYLYFHGASFGKKIDILNKNPNVCVAFYSDELLNIRHKEVACSYSMKFKSILVNGIIENVNDYDKKIEILNVLMKHYTGKSDFKYNIPALKGVHIFRLKLENYTAFNRGY